MSINAIELLKDDHREVEALFAQFEDADRNDKVAIASAICHALAVHAEIEEQIFYPAARQVLDQDALDMIDEAVVEHASLKSLMDELQGMSADEDLFEARVTVLKEYVQHHVKEEEQEFFPKVEKSGADLASLGARLQALKDELLDTEPPAVVGSTVAFPTFTPGAVLKKQTDRMQRRAA